VAGALDALDHLVLVADAPEAQVVVFRAAEEGGEILARRGGVIARATLTGAQASGGMMVERAGIQPLVERTYLDLDPITIDYVAELTGGSAATFGVVGECRPVSIMAEEGAGDAPARPVTEEPVTLSGPAFTCAANAAISAPTRNFPEGSEDDVTVCVADGAVEFAASDLQRHARGGAAVRPSRAAEWTGRLPLALLRALTYVLPDAPVTLGMAYGGQERVMVISCGWLSVEVAQPEVEDVQGDVVGSGHTGDAPRITWRRRFLVDEVRRLVQTGADLVAVDVRARRMVTIGSVARAGRVPEVPSALGEEADAALVGRRFLYLADAFLWALRQIDPGSEWVTLHITSDGAEAVVTAAGCSLDDPTVSKFGITSVPGVCAM